MHLSVSVRGPDGAPPLFCVHGFGTHAGVWEPLAQALEGQVRWHAVDLPGHGQSPEGPWATDALVAALLANLLVVFLPIEIWRRHRAGTLDRKAVLEMLASASVSLPPLLAGGAVLAFVTALWGGAAALVPWSIPTTGWTAFAWTQRRPWKGLVQAPPVCAFSAIPWRM